MRIALTGAGGALGRLVAAELLPRLAPEHRLTLVTRRPAALADLAAQGASVRYGDLDDGASLREALRGTDRVLVISTTHTSTGRRVAQHTAAIDAAIAGGASRVVFTSMPGVDRTHPGAPYTLEYLETEEVLHGRDVGSVVLRNGPYVENLLPRAREALRTGVLTSNAGDGRAAYIARADCAAVAAAALLADGVDGRTLEIAGPRALAQAQIAEILSRVGGRPVALRELSDDAFAQSMRALGVPEPLPDFLTAHHVAVRQGRFALVTQNVAARR